MYERRAAIATVAFCYFLLLFSVSTTTSLKIASHRYNSGTKTSDKVNKEDTIPPTAAPSEKTVDVVTNQDHSKNSDPNDEDVLPLKRTGNTVNNNNNNENDNIYNDNNINTNSGNDNNEYNDNRKSYNDDGGDGDFSDFVVLEIEGELDNGDSRHEVIQVARRFGLIYHGKVGSLDNLYIFKRAVLAEDEDDRGRSSSDTVVDDGGGNEDEGDTGNDMAVKTKFRDDSDSITMSQTQTSKSNFDENHNNNKAKPKTSSNVVDVTTNYSFVSKSPTRKTSTSDKNLMKGDGGSYKEVLNSGSDLNDKRRISDAKGGSRKKRQHTVKRRSMGDIAMELIHSHHTIKTVKPQIPLSRSRRDDNNDVSVTFKDPLFSNQWNIHGRSEGGAVVFFVYYESSFTLYIWCRMFILVLIAFNK